MRSLARCQADAMAIRPLFTEPTTLELLNALADANKAMVESGHEHGAEVAFLDARQAMREHIKFKLVVNDAALDLILGAL